MAVNSAYGPSVGELITSRSLHNLAIMYCTTYIVTPLNLPDASLRQQPNNLLK